jgi:hypothetical protein
MQSCLRHRRVLRGRRRRQEKELRSCDIGTALGSPRLNRVPEKITPGGFRGQGSWRWWRRRDRCSESFDSAWTMPSSRLPGMRGVLSDALDPSARPPANRPVGESMSLYRAGLRLALFLPLGVAIPSFDGAGFTDVSPVVTLPSRAEATIDRTRVRKPSTGSSTYLAESFSLTHNPPTGRLAAGDPLGFRTIPSRRGIALAHEYDSATKL